MRVLPTDKLRDSKPWFRIAEFLCRGVVEITGSNYGSNRQKSNSKYVIILSTYTSNVIDLGTVEFRRFSGRNFRPKMLGASTTQPADYK